MSCEQCPFSIRTGTSVDDGKAHGMDKTRLPVPNLQLCHWSSHLFNLRAPSSTDVPVLLLNQPNDYPESPTLPLPPTVGSHF